MSVAEIFTRISNVTNAALQKYRRPRVASESGAYERASFCANEEIITAPQPSKPSYPNESKQFVIDVLKAADIDVYKLHEASKGQECKPNKGEEFFTDKSSAKKIYRAVIELVDYTLRENFNITLGDINTVDSERLLLIREEFLPKFNETLENILNDNIKITHTSQSFQEKDNNQASIETFLKNNYSGLIEEIHSNLTATLEAQGTYLTKWVPLEQTIGYMMYFIRDSYSQTAQCIEKGLNKFLGETIQQDKEIVSIIRQDIITTMKRANMSNEGSEKIFESANSVLGQYAISIDPMTVRSWTKSFERENSKVLDTYDKYVSVSNINGYMRRHNPKSYDPTYDIFNQSSQGIRSIIELASNAIDASPRGVPIDIKITDTGYEISDSGKGMNPYVILEKLIMPRISGKDGNETIGRFGIGFYTVLSHLKGKDDFVKIQTHFGGRKHEIEFRKHERTGELFVSTKTSKCNNECGTRIEVRTDNFDKDGARELCIDALSFSTRNPIYINGEKFDNQIDDYNLISSKNTNIYSSKEKTNDTGTVTILINGIKVEDIEVQGLNISKHVVLDFPPSCTLPESRDCLCIDENVVKALREMADTLIEDAHDIKELIPALNSIAGCLSVFQDRTKEDILLTDIFKEKLKESDKLAGLNFIPNNKEYKGLQIEGIHISSEICDISLETNPNVEVVDDILESIGKTILSTNFKPKDIPILVTDKYIIYQKSMLEHMKSKEILAELYIKTLENIHEINFGEDLFDQRIKVRLKHIQECKTSTHLNNESHVRELIYDALMEFPNSAWNLEWNKVKYYGMGENLKTIFKEFYDTKIQDIVYNDKLTNKMYEAVKSYYETLLHTNKLESIIETKKFRDNFLFKDIAKRIILLMYQNERFRDVLDIHPFHESIYLFFHLIATNKLNSYIERLTNFTDGEFCLYDSYMKNFFSYCIEKRKYSFDELTQVIDNAAYLYDNILKYLPERCRKRIIVSLSDKDFYVNFSDNRLRKYIPYFDLTKACIGYIQNGHKFFSGKSLIGKVSTGAKKDKVTTILSKYVGTKYSKPLSSMLCYDMAASDIEERTKFKDLTYSKRVIDNVVYSQSNNDSAVITELVQNSRDAYVRNGVTKNREINISTYLAESKENELVIEVQDFVGMTEEQVLNYLLVPHESDKRDEDGLIGHFGQGFFTVLRNAKEVNIKTSDGGDDLILVKISPIKQGERILDYKLYIKKVPNKEKFKGTVVQKIGISKIPALDVARYRDDVISRVGYLQSSDIKINFNGETINEDREVMAEFTLNAHRFSGTYKIYEADEKFIIQNGLRICEIPQELLDCLPKKLRDINFALEVPSSCSLIKSRTGFANKEALYKEIKEFLPGIIFSTYCKYVTNGKVDFDVPYDVFYFSHRYIKKDKNADRITNGEFFSNEMIEEYLSDKDALTNLVLSMKVFTVPNSKEKVSLFDTKNMIDRKLITRDNIDKQLESIPKKWRILFIRQESHNFSVKQDEKDLKETLKNFNKNIKIDYVDISQIDSEFYRDFHEIVTYIAKLAGYEGEISYYIAADGSLAHAYQNGGEIQINLYEKGHIDALCKILKREYGFDNYWGNSFICNIVDTITHEIAHTKEGSGDTTHDDGFYKKQLEVITKLIVEKRFDPMSKLKEVYEKWEGNGEEPNVLEVKEILEMIS